MDEVMDDYNYYIFVLHENQTTVNRVMKLLGCEPKQVGQFSVPPPNSYYCLPDAH